MHDIYPPMCDVDGPRVLIDHLNAYKMIPRYLELIEMSTLDGFGVAIMRKVSSKPLHVLLPEPQRWKRILNKLTGRIPFFSGQISTLIRLKLGITVLDRHNLQPIVGAKLICPQRFGEYRLTGADGTIWLDHYVSNRYLFEAVAEGYLSKSLLIDVEPNQPLQKFTVELDPLPNKQQG